MPETERQHEAFRVRSADGLTFGRVLVRAKAIPLVAADGISPEQAVDEAIARIRQLLAE
jgi:hypothetical protein